MTRLFLDLHDSKYRLALRGAGSRAQTAFNSTFRFEPLRRQQLDRPVRCFYPARDCSRVTDVADDISAQQSTKPEEADDIHAFSRET